VSRTVGIYCGGAQFVKIVRPRLQHFAAFRQSLRAVVLATTLIALGMRKLQLNQISMPSLCVETGRRHRSEAVGNHLLAAEPQAANGGVDRVVADWSLPETSSIISRVDT